MSLLFLMVLAKIAGWSWVLRVGSRRPIKPHVGEGPQAQLSKAIFHRLARKEGRLK